MSKPRKKSNQTGFLNRRGLLWLLGGALILLVAFGSLQLLQGDRANAKSAGSLPAEISVANAAARRDAGAFILDVRTPEEWQDFHMPGSTLIPLDELENRTAEVPRDQEVVVVCRSGNRSQVGRDILLEAGFTQVTSMAGGLNEWRASGYDTVSGP